MDLLFFVTSVIAVVLSNTPKDGSVPIHVTETAGIRRFGYPVQARIALPRPLGEGEHFRLMDGEGKPMAAQFAPRGEGTVELDFALSLGPNESRALTVEYAKGEPPVRKGLRVEQTVDRFRVLHGGGLEFAVPKDLSHALHGVNTNKTEYLRGSSPGLFLQGRDGRRRPVGGDGFSAAITKSGPIACGLRFEGWTNVSDQKKVRSVIEMDFPQSKSWVQVRWNVEDRDGLVETLTAEFDLNLAAGTTLVDFGIGTSVYVARRSDQTAELVAAGPESPKATPAWLVKVGPEGKAAPFVTAPRDSRVSDQEGWAHVMDRERCTAAAVEQFARIGVEDRIEVTAADRLRLQRRFGPKSENKPLAFYLHFVGMPVHVGAQTSPQSMLTPLQVKVGKHP